MTEVGLKERYEAVIGLEIHVQLSTRSKMFCGCSTTFGAPANSHVCPVCLGLPGALPVLNRGAVKLAVRFGRAVGGQVAFESIFARKNYFYPDLPKGYQITQYENPIVVGGVVPFWVGDREDQLQLVRAHLEEDAGKLLHPEGGERQTRIDLNRAGIPLLEIVSEPTLRSPEAGAAALERVHQLVLYLGISEGSMEEGNLRCDANISVRPRGQTTLNPKTEIKNLNSFRHVNRALEYEWRRQALALEDGETLVQATRLWDDAGGRTSVMRTKEDAEDYRYFPEPDLPPVRLSDAEAEDDILETPWLAEARLQTAYGLKRQEAKLLASDLELAAYFEAAAEEVGDPKPAANWVISEVLAALGEKQIKAGSLKVSAESCGKLLALLVEGRINRPTAKAVFHRLVDEGGEPEALIRAEGLEQVSDQALLARAAKTAVEQHPKQLQQFLDGKETLAQFFVGQVMRATRGKANPQAVLGAVHTELERIQRSREGAS